MKKLADCWIEEKKTTMMMMMIVLEKIPSFCYCFHCSYSKCLQRSVKNLPVLTKPRQLHAFDFDRFSSAMQRIDVRNTGSADIAAAADALLRTLRCNKGMILAVSFYAVADDDVDVDVDVDVDALLVDDDLCVVHVVVAYL
jgi:hypothetical protein